MLLAKATLRVCGAGCSQRRGASPGRGGFFLMLRRVRWLPRTLPAWSAGIRSQEQSARRPARMELPATCNKRPRRQGKFPPDGAQCGDGVLCCFCVAQRPHAPPKGKGAMRLSWIRIDSYSCNSLYFIKKTNGSLRWVRPTAYRREATRGGKVGNTYPSHLGNTNNHDICSNDLGRAKCCFFPLQPEKLAPFATTRHRT